MDKVSRLVNNECVKHSFARVFAVQETRIAGGVPDGDPRVFEALSTVLSEPYCLLYVLHTPRGEAPSGRYQSQPITRDELVGFLRKYGEFLSSDARFDIWVHSLKDNGTVVWDRHNHFFAYGPISSFSEHLIRAGFHEGALEPLGAHCHHYRAEFDAVAAELMTAFDWQHSALREEDVQ